MAEPPPDANAPLDASESLTFDDALDQTGYGLGNYYALISCSCIFIHSLVEMVAAAYIIDPAECDLELTLNQKTLIGAGVFIGIVSTAICWGSISDQFGRRNVMIPAVSAAVIFSIGSSLATSFIMMFILRIIAGIFVSASMATVLVYLGELNPAKYRDVMMSVAVSSAALIFVIIPGIAWVIIPGKWSIPLGFVLIKPWRVFMWTWSIPGITGVVILFLLPESPNFILAKSGPDKALPGLAKIYSMNKKQPPSSYPVTKLRRPPPAEESSGLKSALKEFKTLLKPPILRPYAITHFCMFMVFTLANGIYMWMPGIYNLILADPSLRWTVCSAIKNKYADPHNNVRALLNSERATTDFAAYISTSAIFGTQLFPNTPFRGDDDEPFSGGGGGPVNCSGEIVNPMVYPTAFGMELIFLIPFIIVTIIIEKVNKIRLYGYVMFPCFFGLLTCVLVPHLTVAGFLLTVGLCSGSAASILSALAVEVFPTSQRALAMCTMFMVGQVGAILGNLAVGFGAKGPCEIVFIVTSLSVLASIVFLFLFWPDVPKLREKMESKGFSF